MLRSPQGYGPGPEIFDDINSSHTVKDHHQFEALPLSSILKKLCWMRLSLAKRRAGVMLQTRQGRRQALTAFALLLFLGCAAFSVAHLPDADDEARATNKRRNRELHAPSSHLKRAIDDAHRAREVPPWEAHVPPPPPAAASAEPEHRHATPEPQPQPHATGGDAAGDGSDDSEYANDLRRRATELNNEIAKFKAHENAASKQQRLRKTAEQLDKEINALKHVKASAFTLKQQQQQQQQAGAGRRAGEQQQQQQQQQGAAAAAQRLQQQQQQPIVRPAAASFGDLDLPTATHNSRLQQQQQLGRRPIQHLGGFHADAEPHTPTCKRHSEFRIAMVMPWLTDDRSATRFPPWLPYFAATAARTGMLVDWLMLHEGPLGLGELPPAARAPNVKFFDVGIGGIATLIANGMGQQLGLPAANTTSLVNRLRFMFQKWPRLVAEYKPAFGSIFSAYLANYTHWYARKHHPYSTAHIITSLIHPPHAPSPLTSPHSTQGLLRSGHHTWRHLAIRRASRTDGIPHCHLLLWRRGRHLPTRPMDDTPELAKREHDLEGLRSFGPWLVIRGRSEGRLGAEE